MTTLDNLQYQVNRIKLVLDKVNHLTTGLVTQSQVAISAVNTSQAEIELRVLQSMIDDALAVLP